ncbi:MAG: DUF885 family protein [Actinophytocola sp.]|uniref:DUF885 domain-containing protein n=1 Tax=Actinophytocola sp. TaxID=1872138 RepID=UPI0013268EC7|nr:DUF885 domain-containing protein [Actinophytocola sp.]MPZ85212.1 DUF885 family protein [Actinophytocola sp.]
MATILGLPGHDDTLGGRSEQAQQAIRAAALDIAARTEAVDPASLSAADAVTRAAVLHHAKQMVTDVDARGVEYTISDTFAGPAAELISMLPMIVLSDAAQAASYLDRLRAVPAYLDAVAGRHRAGVAAGRVPVAHLVRAAVAHLDRYLGAAEDVLTRPAFDADSFDAERERVLADVVHPAFARYRDVLTNELVQHGRDESHVGLCWLPDGEAMYAGYARIHTTTDRTPEELHRTGLDVIEALTEEYAEIGERVFGTRDRAAIFRRMTSDPAMRWRDADELLESARSAVARAEAATPGWFGRLASSQCKIEPVPAADAPGSAAAYYVWPSMDGKRPGIYFANTHRAEERDRFTSEVTAFHEAVPGHHFQIALAQELTHLPMFRRVVTPNAYAEGWGLYTERLADEMGLYTSDVFRLGMLAMDSLRAGRLVVDTGMHHKGWSRARAVGFLRDNTPMSDLEIGNEIDRYIAYPGQALSYMVGRLEIQRMRAAAEARLGDRFDIKAFHDVVLGNGPLPLAVLDEVVTAWSAALTGG